MTYRLPLRMTIWQSRVRRLMLLRTFMAFARLCEGKDEKGVDFGPGVDWDPVASLGGLNGQSETISGGPGKALFRPKGRERSPAP